jgi:phage-related protein
MKAIAEFAKDTLAPILGKTLGLAFEALGKIISGVISTFATFVNQITKIYNTITGIIDAIRGAGSAVGNFFSQSSMAMASPAPTPPSNNFLTPIMPSVPSGPRISYVNQVTVNGAIDSESTARQIVSILNDSSARGTLGGAGIYA